MLGRIYNATIKNINRYGAKLDIMEETDYEIILPNKEVGDLVAGDEVKAFIYLFEKNKYIATIQRPYITLGEIKPLEVKDVTKIGVFLNWGIEKDLFLPFQEVTFKPIKGMTYLFSLYLDKSNRLAATMRIKELLRTDSEYEQNDWVTGRIYGINHDYGAFVAVDNKYDALIHNKDLLGVVTEGEQIKARVSSRNPDGRLNLTLRDRAFKVIDDDAEKIYNKLIKNNGILRYNDKSNPSDIRREFGISKSSFKKALGKLYKENKIIFTEEGIKRSSK
ncbi:MAG: S1-like domain-containing RNA-binding protein [Tissierellia bacterium]|nr:S1-like domain-containing RNA-binding protein [Tissierellia bacterium]